MSGTREIRKQIGSISSTRKITRAMEMVAASKMRQANQRMVHTRPYREAIQRVLRHVSLSSSQYSQRWLQAPNSHTVGYVVIGTDRGLCGGLNANLFRSVYADIAKRGTDDFRIYAIGKRANLGFRRFGEKLVGSVGTLGNVPQVSRLQSISSQLLTDFADGKVGPIYLCHNKFHSAMAQQAMMSPILPLQEIAPVVQSAAEQIVTGAPVGRWDYIYEPETPELIDGLVARYVEALLLQACIENVACEQAAKMVAMKSASDNASGLIDTLQIRYNKARQAAITQEIAEIVGGAAAV